MVLLLPIKITEYQNLKRRFRQKVLMSVDYEYLYAFEDMCSFTNFQHRCGLVYPLAYSSENMFKCAVPL